MLLKTSFASSSRMIDLKPSSHENNNASLVSMISTLLRSTSPINFYDFFAMNQPLASRMIIYTNAFSFVKIMALILTLNMFGEETAPIP